MMQSRMIGTGLLLAAMLLGACRKPSNDAADESTWVEVGEHRWTVEVASTGMARRRGMGGRTELADDAGMLFVYGRPEPMTFWMHDCLIDLDIAFIDSAGEIIAIFTLPAPAAGESPARCVSPRNAQFVLETNAGSLAGHGVSVGDSVTFSPAVQEIITQLETAISQ
jgi:uncharacterized membrane protein (UPF0127 family)